MGQYRCLHFRIEELVSKSLHEGRGDLAWELFDIATLRVIDELWEHFGVPVTINNWLWGADLENCGYRPASYYTRPSLSQHQFGKAFDLHFKGLDAEDVRREIIYRRKFSNKFLSIGGLETGVSWVHMDTRNTNRGQNVNGGIFLFGK